jgi:phosphohistidine phosphatase SixA
VAHCAARVRWLFWRLGTVAVLLAMEAAAPVPAFATDGSPPGKSIIFLVRHAEPLYPPPAETAGNPPLNVMGQERACALARLLSASPVERVFSTDYRRTRETAEMVGETLELLVRIYDPDDLEGFARSLLIAGGSALVVGHSNTTPQLVELLGGEPGEPIAEGSEFDRLYIITAEPSGSVTTLVLRYGDPLPEDWRELAGKRSEVFQGDPPCPRPAGRLP